MQGEQRRRHLDVAGVFNCALLLLAADDRVAWRDVDVLGFRRVERVVAVGIACVEPRDRIAVEVKRVSDCAAQA